MHLLIGEDVPRWIGRARDDDGPDIVAGECRLDGGEIDAVLEDPRSLTVRPRDRRSTGDEESLFDSLVRIADVLRTEREQDLATTAIGESPGQQVENLKERRLAPGGDRQVFGADRPTELVSQQARQRGEKPRIPLRRIVVAEHPVEPGSLVEQRLHPLSPQRLHRGHSCGIPASQHPHVGLDGHGPTEVIHQFEDAATGGELGSRGGEGKWHGMLPQQGHNGLWQVGLATRPRRPLGISIRLHPAKDWLPFGHLIDLHGPVQPVIGRDSDSDGQSQEPQPCSQVTLFGGLPER